VLPPAPLPQFPSNFQLGCGNCFSNDPIHQPPFAPFADAAFLMIEFLFLATSRDNLRKYYVRASRLLGSPLPPERSVRHVERQSSAEARRQKALAGKAGRDQEVDEEIGVAA
jgi:hypothetical protein